MEATRVESGSDPEGPRGPGLTIASHGPRAFAALGAAIEAAKDGDPLNPVTVAPPSVYAGLSIRRALAQSTPIINTRFIPFARVADVLGSAQLAASRRCPLTPAVEAAGARLALDSDAGVLTPVADDPSTEDALLEAFRELRQLTPDELQRLATRGARQADLVRLFVSSREITGGFYDEPEVFEAAAAAVHAGAPAVRDIGVVILHLPTRLTPAEWSLVEALAGAGVLRAVVGHTGDGDVDNLHAPLVARLAEILGPPARDVEDPPLPTRIAVVPDPEEELRLVARELTGQIRAGVDPARIAVVGARGGPHALIAENVFAEAGVPHHGPVRSALAQSVAGRTLLGALALPDGGFARHEVMAWIMGGPVLDPSTGRPAPGAAWDRRSRQAGITSGAGRWQPRLAALAERLRGRAEQARAGGDAEGAARRGAGAAETEALAHFISELQVALRAPASPSWASFTESARALLARSLGPEGAHGGWPDHEIEARRAVLEALEALAVLDAIDPEPTPGRFRRALDRALRAAAPRTRRFGNGIFVGPVSDAVGASFDVVYVVGMVEGAFPASGRPGALISEADRDHVGAALPTAARRRLAQRHDWLAALASAPVRTCSTPRTDPRAGREQHPSRWLLDAASILTGRPVSGEALTSIEGEPWLVHVASPVAALSQGPASSRDADLLALLAGEPIPELARGLDAVHARNNESLGPWDGLVGGPTDEQLDAVRSPTSLETWARCPFQYFLQHTLSVESLDDPEDIESLSALDRGSLVHEILERFVKPALPVDADYQWTADDHARLDAVIDECFDEYETRGRTGRALLWELEQQRVRRDLHRLLDHDAEDRAGFRAGPVAVELRFPGDDGEALEIPIDDRVVRIRGSIDRVDLAPDGSAIRVIDYKTGRPLGRSATKDPFDGDPVVAGTRLQLPVYALAAQRSYGAVPVTAHYWHVSQRDGFKLEGYDVTDSVLERFRQAIAAIADGVESGIFPANPGDEAWNPQTGRDTWSNCRNCSYDPICPVDRDEAWNRKRHDPALAPYARLTPMAPAGTVGAEPSGGNDE